MFDPESGAFGPKGFAAPIQAGGHDHISQIGTDLDILNHAYDHITETKRGLSRLDSLRIIELDVNGRPLLHEALPEEESRHSGGRYGNQPDRRNSSPGLHDCLG